MSVKLKKSNRPGQALRLVATLLLVAGSVAAFVADKPVTQTTSAAPEMPRSAVAVTALDRLPLVFEENMGQTDDRARFFTRGLGFNLFLTPDGAVMTLQGQNRQALRMTFAGANPNPVMTGTARQAGRSHYLIGRDPGQWHRNVPHFGRVRYQGLYPGIDLEFYGVGRAQPEFDFIVTPHTDPSEIMLVFEGTDRIEIDPRGDIVLSLGDDEVRLAKPLIYQDTGTTRQPIAGDYVLRDDGRIGLQIAKYNPEQPLVIDPVLIYASYLGGSASENLNTVAVDSAGNLFVAGWTSSIDFPTTIGAFREFKAPDQDAFVAKFTADGSGLLFATYLGGIRSDTILGIAVDDSGTVYVTGETNSIDFPTSNGAGACTAGNPAFDNLLNAPATPFPSSDAFVTKLTADGSDCVYSTYLGGGVAPPTSNPFDRGEDIAVDSAGNAYVTGVTWTNDFPVSDGLGGAGTCTAANAAFDSTLTDVFTSDAFVTKLNADGSNCLYSTLVGGNFAEGDVHMALDGTGNVYLTGATGSTDFPVSDGLSGAGTCTASVAALDGTLDGTVDIADMFVTKLNGDGSNCVYSTYFGGSSFDGAIDIVVDDSGNAYVTGSTSSADFPVSDGLTTCTTLSAAFDNSFNGTEDVFAAKFTADGSDCVFSTYLGGTNQDYGTAIALGTNGNVYLGGVTSSSDFPSSDTGDCTVPSLFPFTAFPGGGPGSPGKSDGFIVQLDATGSTCEFSTSLGSSGDVEVRDIVLDATGAVYAGGVTLASDFPVTKGAFQTALAGFSDGFVTKIVVLPVDVGVAGGGFRTRGRVRCSSPPCTQAVAIKVKNFGDDATAIHFEVTSEPPGPGLVGCTGDTGSLPPNGTASIKTCMVTYTALGNFTLKLRTSPPASSNAADTNLTNNEKEKSVKVL